MNHIGKRKTYEERSILPWMEPGETNAQATARLKALWEKGQHPVQLQRGVTESVNE